MDERIKKMVWNKAKTIIGYDKNLWRKDIKENICFYDDYGNENSIYGWEIDHIFPSSKGGSDDLDNLQILKISVNRSKGDKIL